MLAAVCTAYGGPEVVRLDDVRMPTLRADEVLVRVHATTVASADCRIRASRFPRGFGLPARMIFGWSRPRQPILGTECSGTVEAIGARVTNVRPGDAVIAFSGIKARCHAQYVALRADGALVSKPAGLSFAEAATIAFGGTTALYVLRDRARLRRGERVLVNGASGCVGTAAVQLARHLGAHVTGVCSTSNVDLVRSLGADAVVDYRATDFATGGERWDIIIDTVGNAPFGRSRNVLNDKGRLMLVAADLPGLIKAPLHSLASGLTVAGGPAPERAEDLRHLRDLYEAGALRPVIDSTYSFDRIADAHARADCGRKTGSVVVTT